jgi:hypothetical protein
MTLGGAAPSSFSPCGRRCLREAKADEGSLPAETDPSSGTDCVRATFSHKGRREGAAAIVPFPRLRDRTDLPDGRIAQIRVQPLPKKYFAFPVGQIKSTTRAVPSRKRGVAHVINAGRDAVDAGGARDVRTASAFAKASADWRKPRRSLWRRRLAYGKAVWS